MGVQNPTSISITGVQLNPGTGLYDSSYSPGGGGGGGTAAWSDDFESGNNGDFLSTRGFIRTAGEVSTVRAYAGTKSAIHNQTLGSDMDQQYGCARVLPEELVQGDEFWLRTYFFFPTGWDFGNNGDAGLGGSAPRSKFFRLHTKTSGGANKGYNDLYLYNQDSSTQRWNWIKEQIDLWAFDGLDGYAPGRPAAPNANITRNQWVPIEYYIKLHSDPAQARVRVWVDNVLQINITDLATLSLSTDVADEWQFCTYYNGGAPATQSMWTDNWEMYTSRTTGAPGNTDAGGNVFIGGAV